MDASQLTMNTLIVHSDININNITILKLPVEYRCIRWSSQMDIFNYLKNF